MKRKTTFVPPFADAIKAQAQGAIFKQSPIPAGMVRVERFDHHYGQQGQCNLSHYYIEDVAELKAINCISGGYVTVTWPDNFMETFDFAHTPMRAHVQGEFGWVMKDGLRIQSSLSRLPNMGTGYYRPMHLTPQERATFVKHVWDWD